MLECLAVALCLNPITENTVIEPVNPSNGGFFYPIQSSFEMVNNLDDAFIKDHKLSSWAGRLRVSLQVDGHYGPTVGATTKWSHGLWGVPYY